MTGDGPAASLGDRYQPWRQMEPQDLLRTSNGPVVRRKSAFKRSFDEFCFKDLHKKSPQSPQKRKFKWIYSSIRLTFWQLFLKGTLKDGYANP